MSTITVLIHIRAIEFDAQLPMTLEQFITFSLEWHAQMTNRSVTTDQIKAAFNQHLSHGTRPLFTDVNLSKKAQGTIIKSIVQSFFKSNNMPTNSNPFAPTGQSGPVFGTSSGTGTSWVDKALQILENVTSKKAPPSSQNFAPPSDSPADDGGGFTMFNTTGIGFFIFLFLILKSKKII